MKDLPKINPSIETRSLAGIEKFRRPETPKNIRLSVVGIDKFEPKGTAGDQGGKAPSGGGADKSSGDNGEKKPA